MEILASFAIILTLAFLTESLTEYFFGDLLARRAAGPLVLKYLAAGVGVALALAYRIDLLRDLFGIAPGVPFVGEVLTGLILGRGANYVHDFLAQVLRERRGGPPAGPRPHPSNRRGTAGRPARLAELGGERP